MKKDDIAPFPTKPDEIFRRKQDDDNIVNPLDDQDDGGILDLTKFICLQRKHFLVFVFLCVTAACISSRPCNVFKNFVKNF